MLQKFCFLYLFFALKCLSAPFVFNLYCEYLKEEVYVNIDNHRISIYMKKYGNGLVTDVKQLPNFKKYINRFHTREHKSIDHTHLKDDHYHAEFSEVVNTKILVDFLNLLKIAPDGIELIVSDFEAQLSDSNKHVYVYSIESGNYKVTKTAYSVQEDSFTDRDYLKQLQHD